MKLEEMAHELQVLTSDPQLPLKDFDSDTSDSNEINNTHDMKCQLLDEKEVTVDQSYILHISGTTESNFNLAIGTSNKICEVYHCDDHRLTKIEALKDHTAAIVGVQFSYENNNLLYSASADGHISLWDLRLSEKLVLQFTDTSVEKSQKTRPIICFDVSPNNRLLAAGSELYEGEAFILFWDIRNVNLLGGYWESHSDDVTQVKFNPNDVNMLASGSTDGLINIYDLKQTSEDDALVDSLNTESSIEQLLWYTCKGRDCISCITHTVDVQLWKTDSVEPYAHFRRPDISKALQRRSDVHSYIAAAHKCVNDEIFILAGSNWKTSKYLRVLRTDSTNLVPIFTPKENKQRVRSSWYNQHHNILVTGGEKGILNVWNIQT